MWEGENRGLKEENADEEVETKRERERYGTKIDRERKRRAQGKLERNIKNKEHVEKMSMTGPRHVGEKRKLVNYKGQGGKQNTTGKQPRNKGRKKERGGI